MAIQHRRGVYSKFDPTRLVAGEWAIVLSGDASASDGMAAYICFAAGTVKRVATFEDMSKSIADANEQLIRQLTEELTENVDEVVQRAADISEACETQEATRVSAEQTRVSSETARISAETARVEAETARISAEQTRVSNETARISAETAREAEEQTRLTNETSRVTAERERETAEVERIDNESERINVEILRISAEDARKTAEQARIDAETIRTSNERNRVDSEIERKESFAEIEERIEYFLRYTCKAGEYDEDTRRPTIAEPDTLTRYFVPSAHPTVDDWWIEWEWDAENDRWEKIGTTNATFTPVSAEQIDEIAAGTTITGDEILNTTGVSRVFNKLEDMYADIVHKHKTQDLEEGYFEVSQGGTGATIHTTNAVIVGNGTDALKDIQSKSGTLYATENNGEPQFGTLPIAQGGTGATTAKDARQAIGLHMALTWGDINEKLTWGQLRDG